MKLLFEIWFITSLTLVVVLFFMSAKDDGYSKHENFREDEDEP